MATASSSSTSSSGMSDYCRRLSQSPYELHKAVYEGDLETVKTLVQHGPDCVKATDCHGR